MRGVEVRHQRGHQYTWYLLSQRCYRSSVMHALTGLYMDHHRSTWYLLSGEVQTIGSMRHGTAIGPLPGCRWYLLSRGSVSSGVWQSSGLYKSQRHGIMLSEVQGPQRCRHGITYQEKRLGVIMAIVLRSVEISVDGITYYRSQGQRSSWLQSSGLNRSGVTHRCISGHSQVQRGPQVQATVEMVFLIRGHRGP